jgi:hypothetical protein
MLTVSAGLARFFAVSEVFKSKGAILNERVECRKEVIVFEKRKSITTKRNVTGE